MKNANFANASVCWSKFNRAIFDRTVFRRADLSWCIFFSAVGWESADFTDALLAHISRNPSEVTFDGLLEAEENLKEAGLPLDTTLVCEKSLKQTKESWSIAKGFADAVRKIGEFFGYSRPVPSETYAERKGEYARENVYGGKREYKK